MKYYKFTPIIFVFLLLINPTSIIESKSRSISNILIETVIVDGVISIIPSAGYMFFSSGKGNAPITYAGAFGFGFVPFLIGTWMANGPDSTMESKMGMFFLGLISTFIGGHYGYYQSAEIDKGTYRNNNMMQIFNYKF